MASIVIGGVAAGIFVLGGCVLMLLRHRRLKARRLYEHTLEDALADGMLTEEEAEELASLREDHDLAAAEVRMVALSIYRRALQEAAADSRITEAEDVQLRQLQEQLSLSEKDLAEDRKQVQRVRLLARIERGALPDVRSPVQLDGGEVCHWAVQCRTAQRLTIPGAERSPAAYLRFRVEAGTPFYATGERDELRTREDVLPLDVGMLLVTSRRTLFRGARSQVAVPHTKLASIDLYSDGIKLEQSDNGAAQLLLVQDPELTTAILLTAARLRRNEARGTAPGRTA